jgi:EAL domain-containing protein (putative c-di-GMP-specific phosphodiesterase class I)
MASVILELDRDGVIIFAQGRASALLGQSCQRLGNTLFENLIHPSDRALYNLIKIQTANNMDVGPLSLKLNRPGGESAHVEVFAVPLNRKDQNLIQLAIRPYMGAMVGGSLNPRVPSANAQTFDRGDFDALARQLSTSDDSSSADNTLLTLLNMVDAEVLADNRNQSAHEKLTERLWALYNFLQSTARESAATTRADRRAEDRELSADENEPSEFDMALKEAGLDEVLNNSLTRPADTNTGPFMHSYIEDPITESDTIKAAVYSLQKASSGKGQTTMSALREGYKERLERTKNQLKSFKNIVVSERFDVAFQTINDLKTGEHHHFEALARFDPDLFKGSTFEFMCFAEDIGVINEFDLAMSLRVISTVKRMKTLGYNMTAAINISGKSIQSKGFLRQFFRILEDCDDLRDNLMFELTESSQIDDLEGTNRVLSRIRDFGHKVCLDDFGAGAAGIQYLKALKVDCVKIDGIYIRQGIKDPENKALLTSIATMCQDLGIDTVGECVETEEQRDFLAEIGVNYAQGWLYGKPVPADEAIEHLY